MPSWFSYFSLEFILFDFLNYPVSLLELLGIVSGLLCVYTAAKNQIITWPIGIFNSICFFFLFFQVQLYSDMLLQIYFFGSSIYGWMYWQKRKGVSIPITTVRRNFFFLLLVLILLFSYMLGKFAILLPEVLPELFQLPPSYPYLDAFTTTASIVANFLLARRIMQAWFLWVAVDIVCIGIYFLKGIDLVAIEYIVFLVLALLGLYHWRKELVESQSV